MVREYGERAVMFFVLCLRRQIINVFFVPYKMRHVTMKQLPFRPKGIGTSRSDLANGARMMGISRYMGSYFRDEKLPKAGKFIVNIDSSKGNGTHWVAVDADNKIYFDPFGAPPVDEVMKIVNRYSDFQIQNFNEDTCGEYCLYFLKHSSSDDNSNIRTLLCILRPAVPAAL